MFEALLARSSLPNLHPAVIHFPLALLSVAFAADLVAVTIRRRRSAVAMMAAVLWGLGAAGAIGSALSGEQAEGSLAIVKPEVMAAVEEHEEWADRTVFVAIAVALLRFGLAGYARRRGELPRLALGGTLALGAVCLATAFETAEHGGALVYRHGVGVAGSGPSSGIEVSRPAAASLDGRDGRPSSTSASAPVYGLVNEQGALEWRPAEPVEAPAGWSFEPDASDGSAGWIELPERAVLHLRGADKVGDGTVELRLGRSEFQGTVELLYHGRQGSGEALVIEASRLRLVERSREREEILGAAEVALAPGRHTVMVSFVGSHRRALVDGEMLVHGHTEAGAGAVGLLLDGRGRVRIESWKVTGASH